MRTVALTHVTYFTRISTAKWRSVQGKVQWYFRTFGAKPCPDAVLRAYRGYEPTHEEWAAFKLLIRQRRDEWRAARCAPYNWKERARRRAADRLSPPAAPTPPDPASLEFKEAEIVRERMRRFQKNLPDGNKHVL